MDRSSLRNAYPFLLKLFLFLMLDLDERSNARSSKVNIINKIKNMKDIFVGEYIQVWSDEEQTFIAFYQKGVTINIPNEEVSKVLKELKKVK